MNLPIDPTLDRYGLGRLVPASVREIWANEATDFTPWLAENLDLVGDLIGMPITLKNREVLVAGFRLDLLAETADGRHVVIENQLDPSDHSHLGQLMVYASALEPVAVVWIAREFRDAHRRAFEWLNERTDDGVRFFAIKLGVVAIGASARAPELTLAAEPSEVQRATKEIAAPPSSTSRDRMAFFETVMESVARARVGFRKPKVDPSNWVGFSSGPFGHYSVVLDRENRVRVEVWLDCEDRDRNKALFDELRMDAASIEQAIGAPITWDRKDEMRASSIAVVGALVPLGTSRSADPRVAWTSDMVITLLEALESRLRHRALALRER